MTLTPASMASAVPAKRTGLPSSAISPGIGPIKSRHHLDQGALAGAVGAQQGMDLAGTDVEIHAVERHYARERLAQPANRNHGRLPVVGAIRAHESASVDRRSQAH